MKLVSRSKKIHKQFFNPNNTKKKKKKKKKNGKDIENIHTEFFKT